MTEEDKFIVDTFTWSFSRLESFYQCPLAWRRTYIDCEPKCSNAFAEYGSCCHKILEEYEKGELDLFDLSTEYEKRFQDEITTDFPHNKYADLRQLYYEKGQKYFDEIDLPLDEMEILGVEEKVNFTIDDKPFIGFIDLRYKDKNGNVIFMDHKSANIKFNKNNSVSKSYQEKMQMYKRQQYLYTIPFIEAGEKVDYLEWNFFNNQKIYRIPWNPYEYAEAIVWAKHTMDLIEQEELWLPNSSWYYCINLCDHRDFCEYKP